MAIILPLTAAKVERFRKGADLSDDIAMLAQPDALDRRFDGLLKRAATVLSENSKLRIDVNCINNCKNTRIIVVKHDYIKNIISKNKIAKILDRNSLAVKNNIIIDGYLIEFLSKRGWTSYAAVSDIMRLMRNSEDAVSEEPFWGYGEDYVKRADILIPSIYNKIHSLDYINAESFKNEGYIENYDPDQFYWTYDYALMENDEYFLSKIEYSVIPLLLHELGHIHNNGLIILKSNSDIRKSEDAADAFAANAYARSLNAFRSDSGNFPESFADSLMDIQKAWLFSDFRGGDLSDAFQIPVFQNCRGHAETLEGFAPRMFPILSSTEFAALSKRGSHWQGNTHSGLVQRWRTFVEPSRAQESFEMIEESRSDRQLEAINQSYLQALANGDYREFSDAYEFWLTSPFTETRLLLDVTSEELFSKLKLAGVEPSPNCKGYRFTCFVGRETTTGAVAEVLFDRDRLAILRFWIEAQAQGGEMPKRPITRLKIGRDGTARLVPSLAIPGHFSRPAEIAAQRNLVGRVSKLAGFTSRDFTNAQKAIVDFQRGRATCGAATVQYLADDKVLSLESALSPNLFTITLYRAEQD